MGDFTMMDPELRAAFDKIDDRFDKIDGRLGKLEQGQQNLLTWQKNLSHHVEELGVAIGAMSSRLTEVERTTNLIARKVGTTGVPAVGGGHVPSMPLAARGKSP